MALPISNIDLPCFKALANGEGSLLSKGGYLSGVQPVTNVFHFSVSFWFGLIVGFGGFFGLTLGSALSYFLRSRINWIDPVSV